MHTLSEKQWIAVPKSATSTKGSTRSMQIDPELLIASAKGDRKAQHSLYKQAYQLLMGVCSRYAVDRDEAMSLLNQGYLKILTHADKRKENVPVEAWMRRIMINTIIDTYRLQKNYKTHTQLVDYSDHSTIEIHESAVNEDLAAIISADALYHMLMRLPEMTGKVFNMFAIDGYSHKEISELLNISEGTSKWHVNNARTILKNMLDTHD
ncbi:MAG TPA: RNA polymerase sigma factor [Chitinophagales bacterium]|jgi:RNA polymerase sigma-70 factor (ECF subfamily)|nr:RNA polymerase sigma factor [Chitinophagales bacterium]